MERRGMAIQDEKGRITYAREVGKEEGKEEGRLQGSIALVMRQLKKRFGEIPEVLSGKVENLFLEDLESLTEDIFDFNNLEDLSGWLEERKPS